MPDDIKEIEKSTEEINEEQKTTSDTNPLDYKKIKDFTKEELESCTNEYLASRVSEIKEWSIELNSEIDKHLKNSKKQLNEINAKMKELMDEQEKRKKQQEEKKEKSFSFNDFVH